MQSTAELIGQAVIWKVVSTLALIAFLAAVAVIAGIVERRGRAADAGDGSCEDLKISCDCGRKTSMRINGKLPGKVAGANQIATKRPDYVL